MASDARLDWLEDWLTLKLNLKGDRLQVAFKKLLAGDDGSAARNFVEQAECGRVFFWMKEKELVCADAPPAGAMRKNRRVVYFAKLERAPLTAGNIEALVVPGDLGPDTLGQLYRTCQEVYLPLMSNAENQQGWPDVVTRELLDGFQRAVAGIYVTIGQVQGKTLLPLPPTSSVEVAVDNKKVDKERVHVLETAAVTWSRQIKAVLKTEPEQVLKTGLHPGPLVELEFWQSKRYNLASIREQLASDKFRKVMRVLDLTKSTYYPAFARLCKEVDAAHDEAASNVRYLEPLRPVLDTLLKAEFGEALAASFRPTDAVGRAVVDVRDV